MFADDELVRATSQLADYRKNNALSDILDKYAALIEDHRRLKSDYEEEREAREKYKQMARGQERNPFVLVLVDGDGYVFNEDLMGKAGDGDSSAERLARGGTNAARLLNDAVKASLRRKGLEHCQVMVRVYANVAGLSKALSKAGLVGAEKRSFSPFIASFNRSSGLSDFVDAGELKENADFKLRALLQLYAENAQCKHIYFAACHDVGYISDLTPHAGNSGRFTLLGMGVEELPGVFRSAPLDGPAFYRPPNSVFANTSTKTPSSPAKPTFNTSTGADSQRTVCEFNKFGKCKYGATCRYLHVGAANTKTPWRAIDNERSETNAGSAEEPRSASPGTSLPRKEDVPEGHIAVNKNNFRLDPYITPPSPEAARELMARINKQRICNSFHLKGSCDGQCGFDHSPLSPDLKRALEVLARSQPCPKRGACRKVNCNSGHVCQTPDCRHRGGRAFCKLPYTSHSEDLAVATYVPVEAGPRQTRQGSTVGGSSVKDDDAQSSSLSPGSGEDDTRIGGTNGASVEDTWSTSAGYVASPWEPVEQYVGQHVEERIIDDGGAR
ncbi:CCCH zinc finger DNA binding protein [Coniochaeta ligniaria NRRL 30616]|uniref:CCCH zinc finger DNA binding protein n=1 Tax=Coniochaeta ligniaria NRRL 30616 TaxID=1408157 RepID=A0A1J7I8Z5_9PEZI|nr:CCCH zinc finger DNA binding protein [Coniochaeta ligniaria NRRL 30616]